jgi:hypothetical protein
MEKKSRLRMRAVLIGAAVATTIKEAFLLPLEPGDFM